MLAHMLLVPVPFALQTTDPNRYKLLYSILVLTYWC